MNSNESRVARIFAETRTVCVGRLLLEVPTESEIVYGPAYANVDMALLRGAGRKMEEILSEERAATANKSYLARGPLSASSSMLGKIVDGAMPGQKILFGISGSESYQLRSFQRLGGDLFVAWTHSFPETRSYLENIAHLNAVASRIHSRGENEIPTKPGLCIDRAFLDPLPEFATERVTLGVRLKTFPDVHFSMDVTAKDILVESDALEQRLQSAENEARAKVEENWYASIKTLRRGKRNVGPWVGFEVLARMPRQKLEGESHEFAYVSHGEPLNPMLPVLDVALQSGVKENRKGSVDPGVSDLEAVEIWDRLINSIRQRPLENLK